MLRTCASDGLAASEAAAALGRNVAGVYGRARRLGVRFTSSRHDQLRTFLRKGGRLVREEIGGAVGVRWGRAHRSGAAFDTRVCERLLELGQLKPSAEGQDVYLRRAP